MPDMKNNLTRRQAVQIMGYSGLGMLMMPWGKPDGSIDYSASMLQRVIPSSGEKLPVVGLGTWQQFDVGSSASERDPLVEVLKNMAAKGGKLIDSSPMYARAEQVVGDLTSLTGQPDNYFYATKVWTSGEQSGIRQMEDSLRKMKRKTMDLMQVHNLQDWQTHLKTIRKWKEEGKIRYAGVTHYTSSAHAQLEQIAKSKAVDFVQVNFSMRERNAENSLLKACRDSGVAVLINEPFDSGSLFSSVRGKTLPAWASEYDIASWAQFFLKYILSNEAVTCVIPGTSNPSHVLDNMGAGYGKLPDEKGRKKMVELVEGLD